MASKTTAPKTLTPEEAAVFARVLEPTPAPNRRDASGFRRLSFYTSELKAASAIPARLNQIANGQITEAQLNERSVKRYTNTLRNLGLIEEEGLALTPLGESVRHLPELPDPAQRAISIDGAIFRGLTEVLRQAPGSDEFARSAQFFAVFVLNARDFFASIPTAQRAAAMADDYLLLLLQIVFSRGPEVSRYWTLNAQDRALALAAFRRAYRIRSASTQTGPAKRFYLYADSLARHAVQADIRYRVKGLLVAYLDLATRDPDALQELVAAAEVVCGLAPAPRGTRATPRAHGGREEEQADQETALPPVVPAEVVAELPIAHRNDARLIRISGRDAVKRRFSKRATEYGRWAEDSVIQRLREREERGEITELTWRSDIGETPGWDIDYVEVNTQTLKRIEVKGTKGASVDVIDLTGNEMAKLREHGANYALALVTHCAHATKPPKVHFLWAPAAYFRQRGIEPQTAIWTVRLSGE